MVDAEDIGGLGEALGPFQNPAEVHFFQLVEGDAPSDRRQNRGIGASCVRGGQVPRLLQAVDAGDIGEYS